VLYLNASLMHLERWHTDSPEQQNSFQSLCPELVLELVSPIKQGPR